MAAATRDIILSTAKTMAQVHGIGGVSFRDIATRVGIKSASVHHHFPSKDDLILALVQAQRAETEAALAELLAVEPFPARLAAFVGLFRQHLLTDNRFCLCGMISAEVAALSEPARLELATFFDTCTDWLAGQLSTRTDEVRLAPGVSPYTAAEMLVSGIEGAMLIARVRGGVDGFDRTIGALTASLLPSASAA